MTAQVHETLILNGEKKSMPCTPPIPRSHSRIQVGPERDELREIEEHAYDELACVLTKDELDDVMTEVSQRIFQEKKRFSVTFSTACLRGYVGTWEIKGSDLFLVDIFSYRLRVIGEGPIAADWVTGVLRVCEGKTVRSLHCGFASIYENEHFIKVRNGKVVDEVVVNYGDGSEELCRAVENRLSKFFEEDWLVGDFQFAFWNSG